MAPSNSTPGDDAVRRSGSQSSRPNSIASGNTQTTNVFSDEYALEHSDSGGITPVDSIQDSVDLTIGPRDASDDPQASTVPISALPPHMSAQRLPSTSKRPLPADGSQRDATSDTDTRSSLSISSRVNRPQSPYNGPTAPSQPYALYPQVTRASSIASESTVRPVERPFVPQGGPEHPYGMYQNAVPEEDDDENSIVVPPLGFANVTPSFQSGSSSSGNDTGDIVGSDGHVEQLPPYTRYADNVVAKGDMANINQNNTANEVPSSATTDASTLSPNQTTSELELNPPAEEQDQGEVARKEGLYERSKKRKCCGIPLVILILLVVVIIVSAAVGGVVGGVVGNRKGVDHAKAGSSATTTVWLDADPVTTGPSTPPCPTGHYTIPLSNIGQVEKCVTNQALSNVWDCMNTGVASLGITVLEEDPAVNQGSDLSIQFDDYSLIPQRFRYGPQPPDFNGTKFAMQPVEDIDNRAYGVAMFFSHLFDKIIILPESYLDPNNFDKRSEGKHKLQQRSPTYTDEYLEKGDKPWYCFWNQTVEEFWIFLEQDVESSTVSAAAVMSGYPKTASPSTPSTMTTPTKSGSPLEAYTTPAPSPTSSEWFGPKARRKRAQSSSPFPAQGTHPSFPRMIKMVEKRKPHDNIEPYCQQMEVQQDWSVTPYVGADTIEIDEAEFEDYSPPSAKRSTPGSRGLSLKKRDENAIIGDLESLCICEWRAGG
ncbi:uncharacterized protein HMPREF1541_00887 [Cyphellophora europaea CBS 101466]|uniref:DUF7820 domain-containing protein n=1 Tax=Cyphellophora europaea (strain CBS 101466) TaxID=1220924 RepID=W2SDJ8_CYPE1|nr:uncharacterized protein HMPREF1541_00887 [Cyphellophora europaea CBS 101466]ETN46700.1 hypothetical protein HMPREF1541_00887 [Cyphellophora europaea CBS 101466]